MVLYSCHAPSGRAVGTGGWTLITGGMTPRLRTEDACAKGPSGTLIAQIGGTGNTQNVGSIGWEFVAAPDTALATVDVVACGRTLSSGATAGLYHGPRIGSYLGPFASATGGWLGCDSDVDWFTNTAPLRNSRPDGARLLVSAGCLQLPPPLPPGMCNEVAGLVSRIELHRLRGEIRDDIRPIVVGVRGPLASNVSHAGVETVAFDATDKGVGVFRGVVEVRVNAAGPWREMASTQVSPSTTCRPLRETSYLYEFDSPRPCPLAAPNAALSFDNALLPAGQHELRVVLEDAAGHRSDVIPPRVHFVPERTAPAASMALPAASNGGGATRAALLTITAPGRRRLPSAGAFRLAGRLRDTDGRPVAAATLSISSRPYSPRAGAPFGPWTPVGEVVTDGDGVYRARIPKGASRSLLVTYKAHPDDAGPSGTAQIDLNAPAQVTIRAKRARLRNGQTAVIRGRVAGPIPEGGVLVGLEAREPGRWVPVATSRRWVRTRPSGTFTLSYRFRRTFRPTTYRFRVVADEDSAFQYGRGASRAISIRVRP
jgi:hypothetical protein